MFAHSSKACNQTTDQNVKTGTLISSLTTASGSCRSDFSSCCLWKERITRCKWHACSSQQLIKQILKSMRVVAVTFWCCMFFALSLSNKTSDHTVWLWVPVKWRRGVFFSVGVKLINTSGLQLRLIWNPWSPLMHLELFFKKTSPLTPTVSSRPACHTVQTPPLCTYFMKNSSYWYLSTILTSDWCTPPLIQGQLKCNFFKLWSARCSFS